MVEWNGGTSAQLVGGRHGGQPQRSESAVRRPAAPAPRLRPSTAGRRRPTVRRRTDGVPAVPGGAAPVPPHAVERGDWRRTTTGDDAGSMSHAAQTTSGARHWTVAHARRRSTAAARTIATISATRLVASIYSVHFLYN